MTDWVFGLLLVFSVLVLWGSGCGIWYWYKDGAKKGLKGCAPYILAGIGGASLGYILVAFLMWRRRKQGYNCGICPCCDEYWEEKK